MMIRTSVKVALTALALAVTGCGEDNPAPKANESSPEAGLDALKQMQSGGTGPKSAAEKTAK